jgi:branched-chain amino acid transport system permease protein
MADTGDAAATGESTSVRVPPNPPSFGGRQARRPLALTGAVLALLAVSPFIAEAFGLGYLQSTLTRVAILGLAAVALDYIVGYCGLVSLGHALFLGVGAYTTGILLFHLGDGFWATDQALVAWPLAMLVGALLGWVFGRLALRTRAVYFIMVTLAFNQMMFFFFNSLQPYGGDDGVRLRVRNQLGPLSLDDDRVFFFVCFALLVMTVVCFNLLIRSPSGWVLRGARDNELRMRSVGAVTRRHQLVAFVISGAFVALAGALSVNESQFMSPGIAHWTGSGELLVIIIIGGVGSLVGGVLGAGALLLLEELAIEFTADWQFYVGIGLIVIVLAARRGIAGLLLGRHRNV